MDMENTTALQTIINKTTDDILDSWTRAAALAGVDSDEYINLKLDAMAENEADWSAVVALSGRYAQRVRGVAR